MSGHISPRAAAAALQSLNPGYVPPPSRSQIMAENLMAAGERALAMNPTRLASPAQVEANQHAMYGARAGTGKPWWESTVFGDPFNDSTAIPVFPRNSRDSIPVPDPRALRFGQYEMSGDSTGSRTKKDQSRLAPLDGTDPAQAQPESQSCAQPGISVNRCS